ncbi:MAG TPA: hypothetical protein VGF84_16935 [Micromonosporaceae bacterium]
MLMPIGPLTVAIIRLILPYFTTDDSPTIIRKVSADLGSQDAVIWLSLLLVLTLVPSVLAAGRVTIRRAPVLTTIAWILLVPGFVALLFTEGDPTYRALAALDPANGAKVIDGINNEPGTAIGLAIFIAAHVIGIIVLGIAALRSRAVPTAIAWLLIVSQPIHFVFAVIAPNQLLDCAAWLLTTVGFAFLARTALRTTNAEWDLPPAL